MNDDKRVDDGRIMDGVRMMDDGWTDGKINKKCTELTSSCD